MTRIAMRILAPVLLLASVQAGAAEGLPQQADRAVRALPAGSFAVAQSDRLPGGIERMPEDMAPRTRGVRPAPPPAAKSMGAPAPAPSAAPPAMLPAAPVTAPPPPAPPVGPAVKPFEKSGKVQPPAVKNGKPPEKTAAAKAKAGTAKPAAPVARDPSQPATANDGKAAATPASPKQ